MSSTLLLDAASTSITSRDEPSAMATQLSQTPHGSPSSPRLVQLSALARSRAVVVLPRPRDQVGVPDPPVAHGVPERGGDVLLPHQLGEPLWAVLAVQRLVGHGPTVASVNSRNRGWKRGEGESQPTRVSSPAHRVRTR